MTTSAGIGTGLIILLTIWIVALIIAVISQRTEKIIGVIAIATAVIITIIITILPVESSETKKIELKVYDDTFLWRCILTTFLALSSLGSIALLFTNHLTEPLKTVPINNWVY